MKRLSKVFAVFVLALALVLSGTQSAFAYYNLPGVAITLSQSSVAIVSGQTQTVGVSVNPTQEDQLPGCGMAECPQTCPPECIGPGGWCICAGTTFVTKYTQVQVSSSNSSVARASYNGGTLSITGVSQGTATVTVTASLEKHVNSVTYITVSVTAPSGGGDNNNNNNNGGTSTDTSSDSTTNTENGSSSLRNSTSETDGGGAGTGLSGREPIGTNASPGGATGSETGTGTGTGTQGGVTEQAVSSTTLPNGMTVTIVTLGLGADLREVFSKAAGRNERVLVQKRNTAGNVDYSLSFFGGDIPAQDAKAFAGSLEGLLLERLPDNVRADGEALLLRFNDHAKLPSTAEVYVSAALHFSNDVAATSGTIDIYQVDPDTGGVTLTAQGGSIVNGYVVFDLANTNDVIIASGKVSASGLAGGGNAVYWLIVAGAVAALAAGLFLVLRAKRRAAAMASATMTVEEEGEEGEGFAQWITKVSSDDASGEGGAGAP